MADLSMGSTIAGYRVEAVAGRGGMGVVYRAVQLGLDRPVALKLIAPELADDATFRQRFELESQTAASIDHPNVIPVYEAGEAEGRLFIAMRWVPGIDLGVLIRREGRLPPSRAVRVVGQVAAALDAAHRRGLVHRDVKPGNILLTEHGEEHVYLTDFGLTKHAASVGGMTKTGQFVGTPDYTAPEQIRGERADARTDVYALGCVLFQALAGKVPFERDSEVAKIYAHLTDPPPSLADTVPEAAAPLDRVVARALAKQPEQRYPSAGDLGRAARAAVLGAPLAGPERTVATGLAAPTKASPTIPSPADPTIPSPAEPTVPSPAEAGAGQPADPTVPSPDRPATPITTPLQAPPTQPPATPPLPPAAPGQPAAPPRRRRLALLIALPVLVVAGVLSAIVLGGGSGDESGGGGGGGGDGSSGPRVAETIKLGGGPDGMAIDGNVLWVTDQEKNVVRRVDVETNKRIGRAIPVGNNPDGIVPDGDKVWVANIDDGTVSQLQESGDGTVTEKKTVTVGGLPEGLALGDEWLWVTTGTNGKVARVDRASATALDPIDIGKNTVGVLVTEDTVFVSDKGTDEVTRLDPDTAEISGTPSKVGGKPRGLVEADGSVWVANSSGDSVSRINASNGRVVNKSIRVGDNPRDVTFADGYIWVANTDSGTVTRIDAETAKRARRIRVGEKPASIIAGAGSVWVSNSGEGTLSRIEP
jgi:YVTN family beta-propeller protein